MRLQNVSGGHTVGRKLTLSFIRVVSGRRVPDVVRVLMYRPEYFGEGMSDLIERALRGPSEWSQCQRELFASFTARLGDCEF